MKLAVRWCGGAILKAEAVNTIEAGVLALLQAGDRDSVVDTLAIGGIPAASNGGDLEAGPHWIDRR